MTKLTYFKLNLNFKRNICILIHKFAKFLSKKDEKSEYYTNSVFRGCLISFR